MPPANLYVDDEHFVMHKGLKKGEASHLYSRALDEYYGTSDSLDGVKKKIQELSEQNQSITQKIEFLNKRKEELEEKEEGLKKTKQVIEEREQKRIAQQEKERGERSLLRTREIFDNLVKQAKLVTTEEDFEDFKEFIKTHRPIEYLEHFKLKQSQVQEVQQ